MIRTGTVSYTELSENATPLNQGLLFQDSMGSIWSLDSTQNLAALSGEIGRQAIMIGYLNAFYAFAITAFAVCPFLFLAKIKK
jgi:DHA2 family multidrug resistance protein